MAKRNRWETLESSSMSLPPDPQWRWIGPDEAASLLENCSPLSRRQFRPLQAEKWAEKMRQGLWVRNHQGIAVDSLGRLVDGQHRMWAVILSGATIPFLVTVVDKESLDSIDLGVSRTDRDRLCIKEGSNVSILQSRVAKIISRMEESSIEEAWESNKGSIRMASSMVSGASLPPDCVIALSAACSTGRADLIDVVAGEIIRGRRWDLPEKASQARRRALYSDVLVELVESVMEE